MIANTPTLLESQWRCRGRTHLAQVDQRLAPLLESDLHFRAPRESLFAHLMRVIIAQQVSVAAAKAITTRVRQCCQQAGGVQPAYLLAIPDNALLACGLSQPKLRYLKDLACGLLDGSHRLRRLAPLSDEDIRKRLCAIRGIGRWSADMVLIFRLHRSDILPTLDIGLRRAMEALYGLDPALSQQAFHAQAEAIAEHWRPWRSLATRYLWAAGDADVVY